MTFFFKAPLVLRTGRTCHESTSKVQFLFLKKKIQDQDKNEVSVRQRYDADRPGGRELEIQRMASGEGRIKEED